MENKVIKDINISKLIPNVYEGVIIDIQNGKHVLDIPYNMAGISFKNWTKTRGGIFNKDVLNFKKNKPHGSYVLIEENGMVSIVRIVEEDEKLIFKSLKLIDGRVNEKSYMLFKTVPVGQKLTTRERYVEEKEPYIEEPIEIINVDDDHQQHMQHSIQLFED